VGNLLGDVKDLSMQNRIQLESIPSANEHLELMLEAMKRNRKVRMIYQKYGHATPQEYVLSPYCMKLYMRRWYVLGRKADGQLRVFSFDRMVALELTNRKFRVEKSFDAQAYFSESYGVMVDERTEAQRIVLRAYGYEPFYLSDLPLPHSQRELQSHTADPASPDDESYTDFELRLRPTGDFKARLLSLGEWIEVMEPQSLADEIAAMHQRAIDRRTRRKNTPLL
jgi:predicted DNA-binding transcriptional regulator YafY